MNRSFARLPLLLLLGLLLCASPALAQENMVLVKGGTFQMGDWAQEGDPHERPVHQVTVEDFFLAKREVVFSQYDYFCRDTGRGRPDDQGWGRGKRPVIKVSWPEAAAYCNWLSAQAGLPPAYDPEGRLLDAQGRPTGDVTKAVGFRLPTEAEWEYAAREGGRQVRFGNGRDKADPREMNFDPQGGRQAYVVPGPAAGQTLPVGSFAPSKLGLFDLAGNVWEWCQDYYDSAYYQRSPGLNPVNDKPSKMRVVRGGSWAFWGFSGLRATARYAYPATERSPEVGFRLARTVPAK